MNPALMMLMRSSAAAWTPASLPNLAAWFDASDAASITQSGGRVSRWADKSGNGYHATQSTEGMKPTTGANTINSLNVLTFDGGDALVSGASMSLPEVTIVAVSRVTVTTTYGCLLSPTDSGGIQAGLNRASDGVVKQTLSKQGVAWIVENPTNTFNVNTNQLVGYTFSDSGNIGALRLNGAANGSSATSQSLTSGRTCIIAAGPTYEYTGFLIGQIAEIVICSAALTGTDFSNLESYLKTKWGIA